MKKRLRQNIVLLFFGILLRGCVWSYLTNHPGERASIIPSLQILGEKFLGWGFRIVGKDPELISIKTSLIKNFDELAYLVSDNPSCVSPELIQTIEKNRNELSRLSYNDIAGQQYLYYSRAVELKAQVDKDCH